MVGQQGSEAPTRTIPRPSPEQLKATPVPRSTELRLEMPSSSAASPSRPPLRTEETRRSWTKRTGPSNEPSAKPPQRHPARQSRARFVNALELRRSRQPSPLEPADPLSEAIARFPKRLMDRGAACRFAPIRPRTVRHSEGFPPACGSGPRRRGWLWRDKPSYPAPSPLAATRRCRPSPHLLITRRLPVPGRLRSRNHEEPRRSMLRVIGDAG
jgi:hypothetical protein